jgi:hypothetical protein
MQADRLVCFRATAGRLVIAAVMPLTNNFENGMKTRRKRPFVSKRFKNRASSMRDSCRRNDAYVRLSLLDSGRFGEVKAMA